MTFDFANELISELIPSDFTIVLRDYKEYISTGNKSSLIATCKRLGLPIDVVFTFFNER